MAILAGAIAIFIILLILWEAFETIILPRRVTRRFRLTRLVVLNAWRFWVALAGRIRSRARREAYLSFFGPLAAIMLLAVWAVVLIFGFGLLHWALGSHLAAPEGRAGFGTDVYMSGTTFFTLGLGDVVPRSNTARVVTVLEAGLGFGFLALVISYLPTLYQAFSSREVIISMLDARAGSPPAAGELIRRLGHGETAMAVEFFEQWEQWAAEVLESHISYPALAYFRSQHDNQSWLAAMTTVLDACALTMSIVDCDTQRPASLTFAMARHAVVDLSQIFNAAPEPPAPDRLPPEALERLRALLRGSGIPLNTGPASDGRLTELRAMYEPYVGALSRRFLMGLPDWMPVPGLKDNWQKTWWH